MRIFRKLFGGLREPEQPDDYYLGSSIASAIDGFISIQGLEDFLEGRWFVVLRKDYGVSLTRVGPREGSRAAVALVDLEEWADFKRIKTDTFLMGDSPDSPLGYMATDRLALAVLGRMKEQLGGQ